MYNLILIILEKLLEIWHMTKKENLLAAIKKEMIRQIREGEMEFKQNGTTYIVPKEHITLLLSTQSLEVLNISYPS